MPASAPGEWKTRCRLHPALDCSLKSPSSPSLRTHRPTPQTISSKRKFPKMQTTFDVIIIGTGISSIATTIALQKSNPNLSILILERSTVPCGTWATNKYPGCACDIPFVLYTFSFMVRPGSVVFAPRSEIEEYLNSVISAYDLKKLMKFGVTVNSAKWDNDSSNWEVSSTDSKKTTVNYRAKYVVSCTGQLSSPQLPFYARDFIQSPNPASNSTNSSSSITNTKKQPEIYHSAEFPHPPSYLAGKTVAIVGNGSTAVQLVEALQPIVKTLYLHQRSPKWVVPKPFTTYGWGVKRGVETMMPFGVGWKLMRWTFFGIIEALHLIGEFRLQRELSVTGNGSSKSAVIH
jgi:cation diffusion facilitator CzcD-associated flavoprotein CzcO